MSFFKTSKDKEDLKQGGDSKYINGSGFYPMTILVPFVSTSKGGSQSVDFYVNHEGQEQVLYGNVRITNNDGSQNKIGAKVFNQLLVIEGLDEVSEPVEATLPIGKKGAEKEVEILEDLQEVDVIARIQMEYSKFNGNIQEKKIIKAFFRPDDKASAEEIVNNADHGSQYEKEQKYADSITYKDDLTPEEVQSWISSGRGKGSAGGSDSTPKKKAPSFGKKKTFGKKK